MVNPVELIAVGKRYPLVNSPENQKDWGDFWALKDTNLKIGAGRTIGIIGRNGAGKTTLLNIIAGVLAPSAGSISVKGRVVALFNLGCGFQDELSGKENIFLNGALLGASRRELNEKLDSIIEFSELGGFVNMPLGSYSQGMRLRLGFSIAANLEFDILIIDEVLAVGDALFQHKCFERMMDFRRAGKTIIISTQDMGLIERFSDTVLLLDHGVPVFYGDAAMGIAAYRALLNSERFFVGPAQKNNKLVENTKRWTDDVSEWGHKLGTKEAVIERVQLLNRFGVECTQFRPGSPLRIRVYFIVRNEIKEPHFGAAIFRSDGVYGYGPNTKFDGHRIRGFEKGRGYFILDCHSLVLAPGEYRISVAIWDKFETVPYDYHTGYYKLDIIGRHNPGNELLNMPFKLYPRSRLSPEIVCNFRAMGNTVIANGTIKIELSGPAGYGGKDTFFTNDPVTFNIDLSDIKEKIKDCYFWAGIFRDDRVYCQGIVWAIDKKRYFRIVFPRFALLPGSYSIALGVWDNTEGKFVILQDKARLFKMVFDKEDHGTIFLRHIWKWGVLQ